MALGGDDCDGGAEWWAAPAAAQLASLAQALHLPQAVRPAGGHQDTLHGEGAGYSVW